MEYTELLWGFGGVKIESLISSATASLSGGHGTLIFTPDIIEKENLDRDLRFNVRGYEVGCEILLENVNDGDSDELASLMGIIGEQSGSYVGIRVHPRYNVTNTTPIYYDMYLDSDVSFEDLSEKVFSGQKIELNFISKKLVGNIPNYIKTVQEDYWVDDVGDNMVTDTGDLFIFKLT